MIESHQIAHYHLPGLFEFYDLYKAFLPIYSRHKEYFYDWCDIGSIYGSPTDCIWSGGRVEISETNTNDVVSLLNEYCISAQLTFSNSLLDESHLLDKKCNKLCSIFNKNSGNRNGVIIYSDILLNYLMSNYQNFYYVSSTTKVLTDFDDFLKELHRGEFKRVVPDFRLNKEFKKLSNLTDLEKDKVEFLCNECCWYGCTDRKKCYESVSAKNLGIPYEDHICVAPNSNDTYKFSNAMKNPGFIGIKEIQEIYMPMGFSNFKIEGRGLGSAMILEFLLYYMVKPEYQINIREEIYLDSSLDIF